MRKTKSPRNSNEQLPDPHALTAFPHLQYRNSPSRFAAEVLNFHPDPVQTQVLDSTSSRLLLCCTRQWGKSTTTAARAVHQAYFYPDSLILIAAPAGRQSGELFLRCATFLSRLGIPRRGDTVNDISFVLPNGSRIVSLPNSEEKIRGFAAPALLLVDEASRVPDDLYQGTLLPMLVTYPDAPLWLISTPNGRQGFFYNEWANPNSRFQRFTVTAYDCPRIARAALDEQAASMPRHVFETEFLCVFHSPQGTLLTDEEVAQAIDPDATPLNE
jgi:hypothetical protein